MSDSPTDSAAPPAKNRRKPTATDSLKQGTSNAFSTSLGLATLHYLYKCFDASGHFTLIRPEDALVELWLPTILVPFNLIWVIITNRLKNLAGEDQ